MVSSVDGLAGAAAVVRQAPPQRREVASEAVTGRHVRFTPMSDICSASAHVRFGSKADIPQCNRHVRFTPESGH
jgi:hypothetical protein